MKENIEIENFPLFAVIDDAFVVSSAFNSIYNDEGNFDDKSSRVDNIVVENEEIDFKNRYTIDDSYLVEKNKNNTNDDDDDDEPSTTTCISAGMEYGTKGHGAGFRISYSFSTTEKLVLFQTYDYVGGVADYTLIIGCIDSRPDLYEIVLLSDWDGNTPLHYNEPKPSDGFIVSDSLINLANYIRSMAINNQATMWKDDYVLKPTEAFADYIENILD